MTSADTHALRIGDQDWRHLVIEAWPAAEAAGTLSRELHLRGAHKELELSSDGQGGIHVALRGIAVANTDAAAGAVLGEATGAPAAPVLVWHVRLHLARADERIGSVVLDGATQTGQVTHLGPAPDCTGHFPFGGVGARPACRAGPVAEIGVRAAGLGWRMGAGVISAGGR